MGSLRITQTQLQKCHVERHIKLKDLFYSRVLEEGGVAQPHRGPNGRTSQYLYGAGAAGAGGSTQAKGVRGFHWCV